MVYRTPSKTKALSNTNQKTPIHSLEWKLKEQTANSTKGESETSTALVPVQKFQQENVCQIFC